MDEATTVPTRYEIGFNNSHSYDEYKTIRYCVAGLSIGSEENKLRTYVSTCGPLGLLLCCLYSKLWEIIPKPKTSQPAEGGSEVVQR